MKQWLLWFAIYLFQSTRAVDFADDPNVNAVLKDVNYLAQQTIPMMSFTFNNQGVTGVMNLKVYFQTALNTNYSYPLVCVTTDSITNFVNYSQESKLEFCNYQLQYMRYDLLEVNFYQGALPHNIYFINTNPSSSFLYEFQFNLSLTPSYTCYRDCSARGVCY